MIERFEYSFPYQDTMRTIHLYVPPYYYESTEHYPVMYMLDGHNLFHDASATYGTSWDLEYYLDQSDKKIIVVGIECPHEGESRLAEYAPCLFESPRTSQIIHGYGDEFLKWIIHQLKPFVDTHYRTLPFREQTAIGGSSMGGLMALFGVIAHNQYFSKAACLSPSIGVCREYLKKAIDQVDILDDTRVYLSYGEREVDIIDTLPDDVDYFSQAFTKQNVTSLVYKQIDGEHNEASWREQNPLYINFLWDEI
ncbi:alpha/beta hydrolase [Aerococcaceae bacterium DSM 111020]|nr:alpha/beta hydrolase [Aerococcaceae bacterium DSM 111020]